MRKLPITNFVIQSHVNAIRYNGAFWSFRKVNNPVTGRVWMDRNLGATQVALAMDDADSYGDLFQWGRLSDGHQSRSSSTSSTLSSTDIPQHGNFITNTIAPFNWRNPANNDLWQLRDLINLPVTKIWRLPTLAEWWEEINSWGAETDRRERAFNGLLKLPTGGFREVDGTLAEVGVEGFYWTSTTNGGDSHHLHIFDTDLDDSETYRARGLGIRLIRC